jgi:hypothetical protein
MGLTNSPYVGVEQRKKPQPMFCVSVKALVSFRHIYLVSFLLDPEDVKDPKSGGNLGL